MMTAMTLNMHMSKGDRAKGCVDACNGDDKSVATIAAMVRPQCHRHRTRAGRLCFVSQMTQAILGRLCPHRGSPGPQAACSIGCASWRVELRQFKV